MSYTRCDSGSIAMPCAAAYHQVVTQGRNRCPADLEEIAEAYALGTLPMESAVAFEDHYVGCARCAAVLQEAAE